MERLTFNKLMQLPLEGCIFCLPIPLTRRRLRRSQLGQHSRAYKCQDMECRENRIGHKGHYSKKKLIYWSSFCIREYAREIGLVKSQNRASKKYWQFYRGNKSRRLVDWFRGAHFISHRSFQKCQIGGWRL
jgi:hypothetical protein